MNNPNQPKHTVPLANLYANMCWSLGTQCDAECICQQLICITLAASCANIPAGRQRRCVIHLCQASHKSPNVVCCTLRIWCLCHASLFSPSRRALKYILPIAASPRKVCYVAQAAAKHGSQLRLLLAGTVAGGVLHQALQASALLLLAASQRICDA